MEIEDNVVRSISFLENPLHPIQGCIQPVALLKANQVDSIIVGGMGTNPFKRFSEVGISVFFADHKQFPDVQSAVDSLLAGKLAPIAAQHVCGGSRKCHQHHGKV